MTKTEFLNELQNKLAQEPEDKQEAILKQYDELISQAIRLGHDERSVIASFGPIADIAHKHRAAENVSTITHQKHRFDWSSVISYGVGILMLIIAIAMIGGVLSFATSYFWLGLRRLIMGNGALTGAQSALYIGQMLVGVGIFILIIGIINKLIKCIPTITSWIKTKFFSNDKGALDHE